jgi:Holliday junction resolvase
MAAEKRFEDKVKKFLKDEGCWFLKYWGGAAYTKSGIPDLLVCCNGHFLGIELKAPNGRPSELQLWNIEKIKEAGGIAMVLYPKDFDSFKKLIYELKEGGKP